MEEYIKRAAVEKMLENAQFISDGEYCGYCTEDVHLDSIPTADVVEVRHGRWLLDGRCSECYANPLTTHKNDCPNCGARMDKEAAHD